MPFSPSVFRVTTRMQSHTRPTQASECTCCSERHFGLKRQVLYTGSRQATEYSNKTFKTHILCLIGLTCILGLCASSSEYTGTRAWLLYRVTFGLLLEQLVVPSPVALTAPFLCFVQEVQDEAQWEEADRGGEEAIPGARAHQGARHRLPPEGAGGVAPGDRPQRMAGQQQYVSGSLALASLTPAYSSANRSRERSLRQQFPILFLKI